MITETRLWKPSNGKTYLFTKKTDKNGEFSANLREIKPDGTVSEPLIKKFSQTIQDGKFFKRKVIREADGYFCSLPRRMSSGGDFVVKSTLGENPLHLEGDLRCDGKVLGLKKAIIPDLFNNLSFDELKGQNAMVKRMIRKIAESVAHFV